MEAKVIVLPAIALPIKVPTLKPDVPENVTAKLFICKVVAFNVDDNVVVIAAIIVTLFHVIPLVLSVVEAFIFNVPVPVITLPTPAVYVNVGDETYCTPSVTVVDGFIVIAF